MSTAQADAQGTISALSTGVAAITATANAVPTATPEPTATSTPMPTPTPVPQAGDVLYETGETGFQDWPVSQDWKTVGGMLVNDGTNQDWTIWIPAPYQPGDVTDYAIEAQIQWVRRGPVNDPSFGIVARASDSGAYWTGMLNRCCYDFIAVVLTGDAANGFGVQWIAEQTFDPGDEWHAYRVEVQGNAIRLLIDNTVVLETTDNKYLAPGELGLWTYGTELNVRSFKVTVL